jgi:hypothetical protein
MNDLRKLVPGYMVLGITLAAAASTACEAHDRVVVHDRPEVVREHVVVAAPPPPVVQERVVVHP